MQGQPAVTRFAWGKLKGPALRPHLGNGLRMLAPAAEGKRLGHDLYQSPEWRRLMTKLRKERGNRCEQCGQGGLLYGHHVHELRDTGLGAASALDPAGIKLLCHACHTAVTHENAGDRKRRQWLERAARLGQE